MGRKMLPMSSSREYPERPVVGIGGVIIDQGRTLLIRRGNQPLLGEWSIPGGTLEIGESLEEGVARELLEETGIEVRVLELIEVFTGFSLRMGQQMRRRNENRGFTLSLLIIFANALAASPARGAM